MNATPTKPNAPTVTHRGASNSDKHCVFRSGSSWFSVPAVAVREIVLMPAVVRVPSCHPALVGICHLRSEFTPVISLNALLGVETDPVPQSHDKLIVMRGSGGPSMSGPNNANPSPGNSGIGSWALRIVEATSLQSLETLGTSESRSDEANPTPVISTAMFRDQIVRVLDPTGLYRQVRRALEDLWSETRGPLA